MKICTIAALVGAFVFVCLGIQQLSWLRDVCRPILDANTNSDLIISRAQIFGVQKELSLSFTFAGASLEVAAFLLFVAVIIVAMSWKARKNLSISEP